MRGASPTSEVGAGAVPVCRIPAPCRRYGWGAVRAPMPLVVPWTVSFCQPLTVGRSGIGQEFEDEAFYAHGGFGFRTVR